MTSMAFAAEEAQLPQTVFKNVDIFNGTENKLYENHHVLVEGNKIKTISAKEISVGADATVIDGTGKTLTPGFIENHAHLMLMGLAFQQWNLDLLGKTLLSMQRAWRKCT